MWTGRAKDIKSNSFGHPHNLTSVHQVSRQRRKDYCGTAGKKNQNKTKH